jgi:hypothetical protein
MLFTPTGITPGGSTSGSITKGSYDIARDKGPYARGTYRVEISSLSKSGKTAPAFTQSNGTRLDLFNEAIPAIYNVNSTLSVTISEDQSKNHFTFSLTKATTPKVSRHKRK